MNGRTLGKKVEEKLIKNNLVQAKKPEKRSNV